MILNNIMLTLNVNNTIINMCPTIIAPTQFGFDDIIKNKNHVNKLKKKNGTELYSVDNRFSLYEYPQEYAYIDMDEGILLYDMKYQTKKIVINDDLKIYAVHQVRVWRNVNSPYTGRIPTKIFFDYLLPKTGIIITDSQQSLYGKAFWYNRIGDAFDKGLYVYYVDVMRPKPIQIVRICDDRELRKYDSDIWGQHKKHMSRKIIISNRDLI